MSGNPKYPQRPLSPSYTGAPYPTGVPGAGYGTPGYGVGSTAGYGGYGAGYGATGYGAGYGTTAASSYNTTIGTRPISPGFSQYGAVGMPGSVTQVQETITTNVQPGLVSTGVTNVPQGNSRFEYIPYQKTVTDYEVR